MTAFQGIHEVVEDLQARLKRYPKSLPQKIAVVHLTDEGERTSVLIDGRRNVVRFVTSAPSSVDVYMEFPWSELEAMQQSTMRVVWLWLTGSLKVSDRAIAIEMGQAIERLSKMQVAK